MVLHDADCFLYRSTNKYVQYLTCNVVVRRFVPILYKRRSLQAMERGMVGGWIARTLPSVCMYVCMVTHIVARVRINRVRMPILLVVS